MKTPICNYQLILILLLFFGCSQKGDERISFIDTSPVSIQLKNGVPTPFNIISTSSLQIIDTCLIAFNTESDNLFEVYSTGSHDKIGGFGRRGRGPGEFGRVVELTGQITNDEITNRPILYAHDLNEKKLHYIDLYASINDFAYINKSEVLPDVDIFTRRVIHKGDSLLYFVPENNGRMMIYNFNTEEIKTTPFLPDIGISILEENKWMAYHSVFAVNEESKKIAAAPILLGQVDFFDFSGDYIQSTNFDDFKNYKDDLIAENLTKTAIKMNIVEIKKSSNAFYALNLDLSYTLIRDGSIPVNCKILKFDWDGNLLKEYVLDQPVNSFAYDEVNNRFYIFNPFNTEQSMWYYELN